MRKTTLILLLTVILPLFVCFAAHAAEYPDQIPEDVKGERFRRMLALQNGIGYEINKSYVGKTVRVLCDGKSKNDENTLAGRTDGGKNVCFEGTAAAGEYADVEITEARPFVLMGKQIHTV